ncbi:MAG: hypothetical protein QNK37_38475 [Acidobacteriota bacterium]|nr:hypothetical protein [Acidobacteriota bacterium]
MTRIDVKLQQKTNQPSGANGTQSHPYQVEYNSNGTLTTISSDNASFSNPTFTSTADPQSTITLSIGTGSFTGVSYRPNWSNTNGGSITITRGTNSIHSTESVAIRFRITTSTGTTYYEWSDPTMQCNATVPAILDSQRKENR